MPLPPSGADHQAEIGRIPMRTAALCSGRLQRRIFSWCGLFGWAKNGIMPVANGKPLSAVQPLYIMPLNLSFVLYRGAWTRENCVWEAPIHVEQTIGFILRNRHSSCC